MAHPPMIIRFVPPKTPIFYGFMAVVASKIRLIKTWLLGILIRKYVLKPFRQVDLNDEMYFFLMAIIILVCFR